MKKAYDILLETEIEASIAAFSGKVQHFRYECACCGEEVILAARSSSSMIPHFRHRCENNGKACEDYLGNFGGLGIENGSRRSKKDNVDFYFNSMTRLFYVGVKYSEQLINEHEKSSSVLLISNNQRGEAFFSIPITRQHFAPNIVEKIHLGEFSHNYYVWNSLDNGRRTFECFKKERPTFFKILGNDTTSFYAKLVKSDVLYIGTWYLMIVTGQGQYSVPAEFRGMLSLQESSFSFDTMKRNFSAKIIKIPENTSDMRSYWESCGYLLRTPEFILPLWPPMAGSEESIIANQKDVFIKTSFDLQAQNNINVHSRKFLSIGKLEDRVYKIEVEPSVKIHEENADILFLRENAIENSCELTIRKTECCKKFECPKGGRYFVFATSGVEYLCEGRRVVIFPGTIVRGYLSNYSIIEFLSKPQLKQDSAELLNDILKNYKVEEVYNQNCTSLKPLSAAGNAYKAKCLRYRKINIVVKKYINGGKL